MSSPEPDLVDLYADLRDEVAGLHSKYDQIDSAVRTINGALAITILAVLLTSAAVALLIREAS